LEDTERRSVDRVVVRRQQVRRASAGGAPAHLRNRQHVPVVPHRGRCCIRADQRQDESPKESGPNPGLSHSLLKRDEFRVLVRALACLAYPGENLSSVIDCAGPAWLLDELAEEGLCRVESGRLRQTLAVLTIGAGYLLRAAHRSSPVTGMPSALASF